MTFNVVCSADEQYAQHCGVMLCSLFHNNVGTNFRVFVITDGMSNESREKLERVAADYKHRLEWREIDIQVLRGAAVSGWISLASYFRILIPRMLPAHIERVLYLDCDLVVRGPLPEFYALPLDDYTHAAVRNEWQSEWRGAPHTERLGIPRSSTYFNAGVLLMNVRKWREQQLTEKVLEYVSANTEKLTYHDQDALNATLHARWRPCALKWNAQAEIFENYYTDVEPGISAEELAEARRNPVILHFSGARKPWSYFCNHPSKNEYYRYLQLTPWSGYRPSDTPSATQRLRQLAARIAPQAVKRSYRRLSAALRSVTTAYV